MGKEASILSKSLAINNSYEETVSLQNAINLTEFKFLKKNVKQIIYFTSNFSYLIKRY